MRSTTLARRCFQSFPRFGTELEGGFLFTRVVVALHLFVTLLVANLQCSLLVVVVAKYRARAKVKKTREREANCRGTCLGFQMYEMQLGAKSR